MRKCAHIWSWTNDYSAASIACVKCKEPLSDTDAMRKLNFLETLSTKDKKEIVTENYLSVIESLNEED